MRFYTNSHKYSCTKTSDTHFIANLSQTQATMDVADLR